QQQQRQDALPPSQQQQQQQRQQDQQQQGSARNALFGSERPPPHGRVQSGSLGGPLPLGEHRRVRDMTGGGPPAAEGGGGRARGPRSGVDGAPQDNPRIPHVRERPYCSPGPFRGHSLDKDSDRDLRRQRGAARTAELRAPRGSPRGPEEPYNA